MAEGLTQGKLAAGLGISQPMVSKLVAMGMPTASLVAARTWREQNLADTEATFGEARRRRELAQAQLAELDLAERDGDLISKADVQREARDLAARLVGLLSQLPDRLAVELGADDAQRNLIRRRLREEIHNVRATIAAAEYQPQVRTPG